MTEIKYYISFINYIECRLYSLCSSKDYELLNQNIKHYEINYNSYMKLSSNIYLVDRLFDIKMSDIDILKELQIEEFIL